MINLDTLIVTLYVSGLFIFAIRLGRQQSLDDFMVMSRKAPFALVVFSIVSTWVGIGTTVATSASAYDKGISLGLSAACGGVLGIFAALKLAPKVKNFGDRHKAYTLADFFSIRYNSASRTIAAIFILSVYVMLTAAQFLGLSALLEVWTGIEANILVWFTAISTIIYTAFAGMRSDFYTDIIHFIVMAIVLFVVMLPLSYVKMGGYKPLLDLNSTYYDPFAYGGISFFIASLVFGCVSVFVTMEIWQRIYASSSLSAARNSLVVSLLIIVLFYAISTYFGLVCRALELDLASRDNALFTLMTTILPPGAFGLGLAAFIAIFISTINSTIMVAAATLSNDLIFPRLSLNNNPDRKLSIARLSTLFCGIIGLIISLLIPNLVALSVNALLMLLIIAPAIVGGFYFERPGNTSALLSMAAGAITLFIFLFLTPETAFVPAAGVSLITYIISAIFEKPKTKKVSYEHYS
ncbi:sodium:solute symporter family protein [uncultured Pseudodesulfovibrio sp.]|uniref:sodium:solute symporter family protein n=1 Tax=uncultured Pseudodesulfovibrio sp. TaxID=2035858 RepID=UPI0029C7234A|nr:sodium:solute symporter family protein [uncultured Pseudodesulfovibrio sp.]